MASRAGWATLCALLAAVAPQDAPALQFAVRIESTPGLDDAQRDLLRREYRLAEALSDQNARLNELFERILGTQAAIESMRAEAARPDGLPSVVLPDPPVALGAARRSDEGDSAVAWMAALGAGAALLGMAWRQRRPRVRTQPADAATIVNESPETEIMEVAPQPAVRLAVPTAPQAEDADKTIILAAPPQPEPGTPDSDVATTLDLVQVLLHHGSLKGAVIALRDFLAVQPAVSVRPWLKLLEVYRQAGMRDEFDETAKAAHRYFNLRVPDWDEGLSGEPLRSFFDEPADSGGAVAGIEQIQHVLERVVAAWPAAACFDYLRHLLDDNRDGERGGFPVAVVNDILFLQDILESRLAGETTPMEKDQ